MQKWNLHKKLGKKHCYWFRFVLAGTIGIFRTGMQTSTIIPLFHLKSNFGVFWPFWQISAKIQISVGTRFWLRKKKKKSYLLLLLLGYGPFFFLFSFSSSSSSSSSSSFGGFQTFLLLFFFFWFFLLVGLATSLPFLFYLLCFCRSTLFSFVTCVLQFEFFFLFCFCEPHVTNNKNEYSSLNPLPLFQLLILTSSFFFICQPPPLF